MSYLVKNKCFVFHDTKCLEQQLFNIRPTYIERKLYKTSISLLGIILANPLEGLRGSTIPNKGSIRLYDEYNNITSEILNKLLANQQVSITQLELD